WSCYLFLTTRTFRSIIGAIRTIPSKGRAMLKNTALFLAFLYSAIKRFACSCLLRAHALWLCGLRAGPGIQLPGGRDVIARILVSFMCAACVLQAGDKVGTF